jgi:hypothetical protein
MWIHCIDELWYGGLNFWTSIHIYLTIIFVFDIARTDGQPNAV